MVRMTDLHEAGKSGLKALDCPSFDDKPFTTPKPLKERKIAIVSSAGLIARGSKPFKGGDAGYRTFTQADKNNDVIISHISVNFDRTAPLLNIESIFPRHIMAEMAKSGEIGTVADTHYSFMGATDPLTMQEHARTLSAALQDDGVDTVVLLPV